MNVQIKLFAGLAETLQSDSIRVSLSDNATVGELVVEMKNTFPHAADQINRALVAVNRAYAAADTQIRSTDEIALIPPVGGGAPAAGTPSSDRSSCLISEDPLDVQAAYAFLEDRLNGGTVLFCGSVREWTQGRQTQYLDYQSYVDMARLKMFEIAEDVRSTHPDIRTLQWHRVGLLKPTEMAVICGASAPHRDTAFIVARTLIDRLKKEVPIWKKEVYADGTQSWQANP